MSVLFEATRILSTPLGSLVYHLLLLLAVESILGMAWEEWRRARRGQAQRLLVAAGGLIVLRLAYVAASLMGMAGWIDPVVVLLPLERLVDTTSLALLAWVLFPAPGAARQSRPLNLFLVLNLAALLVAGIVFTLLWGRARAANPTLDYNYGWQAMVWSIWQIALAAIAGAAVARARAEGWVLFMLTMALVAAGRALQLGYPGIVPQVPAWDHLSNLIAYPVLAVAVYQSIVSGLRQRSRQLQDISQASMDQIKSLLFLFEAGREMSGSLDLPTVLDNAVQGIARALDADQCAIAFPQENDPGQMRLAAIYNPARQGRGEGVAFPLDYQLAVRQAMRRKRYVTVEEADNVQLKVLFALLGSSDTGPLLIQPLLAEDEAIGAIIVGNARSRRPFTPNEAKLCQSMAEQVVGAIQNSRRFRTLQTKSEELNRAVADERRASQQAKSQVQELTDRLGRSQTAMEDLGRREEAAREARNALEIRLVSSRAEAGSLSERLQSLESDLAQTHANAEAQLSWHRNELARQEAAWQEALQTQERLQTILNSLTAGLLITDADGRIQEINVAAEILLDREAEHVKGETLRAVSDDPRWQQAVATAGGGEAVRLRLPVGDNTLLCDVAPIPAEGNVEGRSEGVIVILQDVSTETEEQRARLREIATRVEQLKGATVTTASCVDQLLGDSTRIAGSKLVLRLKNSVDRMGQSIDALAHLAAGGDLAARLQAVDVNQAIQVALSESEVYLKDKALAVDLELPDVLPSIEADPDDLRQVMSHLLLNAYLASPTGAHIRVHASRTDGLPPGPGSVELNGHGFVVISIRDCGGGLPREALVEVFDRDRPVRTPRGLGASGADLALVKALVEAQRGRVWVETEQGVGTTFSFALPIDGQI